MAVKYSHELQQLCAFMVVISTGWASAGCGGSSAQPRSESAWHGTPVDSAWFRSRHGSCQEPAKRAAADLPNAVIELGSKAADAGTLVIHWLPPTDQPLLAALETQRTALTACLQSADQGAVLARSARGAEDSATALCSTLDRATTECVLSNLPSRADQPISYVAKSGQAIADDSPWKGYASSLRRAIEARGQTDACQHDAKAVWPQLQERMIRIEFVVSGTGAVEQAKIVKNQTGIEDIACCLRAALETMVFEPPPECHHLLAAYEN